MQTYARIQDGLVMELLATDRPIESLFHPGLLWVAVPEGGAVVPGMHYDGKAFLPTQETVHIEPAPSLHSIMAILSNVQEQLVALKVQPS